MKKIFTLFLFSFTSLLVFGQATECSELFISQYVEGYGNNRALEIYNPTNATVDLSEYSVGRFSNGGASYEGIDIPDGNMLAPYETFVIVLDKRDSLGSGFETPVWNGYQLYDYCTDILTGDTLLNMEGDTIYCVQYDDNGLHLYGDVYRDFLDLEGKADVFLCPVYNVNNAMYFNGDDAVALVKGSTVSGDGSNVLDVIGVIGESVDQSWVNADGGWLTRDKTLERNIDVMMGTGPVAFALQDTFNYQEYTVWWKNYFGDLGEHDCYCDPEFSSTKDLNQVEFQMFPNPTTNDLFIRAEETIERVEIYNLLGERVLIQTFGDIQDINLRVGKFETGMYVVSLFFDNKQQTIQKFIKK